MSHTVLILTERALTHGDAQAITDLHRDEEVVYRLLVPEEPGTGLLTQLLNDLSLLDLRKLVEDLRPHDPDAEHREAQDTLDRSVTALREAGAEAEGEVTVEPPLTALGVAVDRLHPREIVVVTLPHAVEDTLHTDWASIARQMLGLPVLHLYGGTGRVG